VTNGHHKDTQGGREGWIFLRKGHDIQTRETRRHYTNATKKQWTYNRFGKFLMVHSYMKFFLHVSQFVNKNKLTHKTKLKVSNKDL